MAYNYDTFVQARPDMLQNWNNILAYRQNPNDPRWANDPNVATLSNQFATVDDYFRNSYTNDPASVGSGGSSAADGGQPPSLDFGSVVNAPQTPPVQLPDFQSAPTFGGNFATSQVGGQTGAYGSYGTSNQTQSGNQTQNQNQSSTGSQTQTGTSTTSSGVSAPFDVGALVDYQLDTAGVKDRATNEYLLDFMRTGGTGFQSQVDQAVRNSLSGPQMSGAGDSARARAAGYAGAQIGRTNADQRLQAANQLRGPNATASVLGATTPLFGTTQATTNTGTSNTAQNTAGTSNTIDFQSLVGNEATGGTATGQSSQQAGGLVPQGQPVQTGGCVVCTAYVARGAMHRGAIRRAAAYKKREWKRYGTSLTGYLTVGPFIARAILKYSLFARLFRPIARTVLYHEVYLSAPTRVRFRVDAYITHAAFDAVFWPIGAVQLLLGHRADVRDKAIRALLVEQKLNFTLQ